MPNRNRIKYPHGDRIKPMLWALALSGGMALLALALGQMFGAHG